MIGAPGVDDAGPESGAAYVFIYSGDGGEKNDAQHHGFSSWVQQAKLIGDDTSMFDHFGTAVAIHENTAVIGAHGKDEESVNAGAAYVFVRNGDSWVQQAKLTHQNPVPGDQFGHAVAIYGDNALIGAHRRDATGPDSGAAYIFTRNGGTWGSQDFELIPNDSGLGDEFGYAVDLTGGIAIIGAPKEDRSELDMGAAYIFVETQSAWLQQAKLTANAAQAGDEFGAAVAIHQDTAIVGAWKDDHPAPESGDRAPSPLQIDQGSAYSFLRDGLTWVQKRRIVASGANRSDLFGASVAIRGAFAIVGAAGNDSAGDNAGSAFIYNPIDLGFQTADVPFPVDPTAQTLTTLGHIKHTTVFQNYPNPFNPETWFPYNLAEQAEVSLKIYDIGGGLVRLMNIGLQEPGNYQSQEKAAYWDGRDKAGTLVASGIYFYTFTAGDFQSTRRMVILK